MLEDEKGPGVLSELQKRTLELEELSRRIHLEGSLTEGEEFSFAALAMLPVTLCLQASDYTIRFANQLFKDYFGDPQGRPCYEILHGRAGPCEKCRPFEVLRSGEPQTEGWTNPDGRHFLVHYYPFLDMHGKRLVLEMGLDISEQKQAEDSLEISELKLRRITDSLSDASYQVDGSANILYASPSLRSMLGYDPEELKGSSFFELVHLDDLERLLEAYREYLGRLEPRRAEFRYRRSDGRFLWMESLVNPTFDKDGSHDGAVISLKDITERKQAGDALRTSEEKYNATFETTGTAMFLVDRDALISDTNREMETLFGYSRDEVVGKMRYMELLMPEDEQKVKGRSLELLRGESKGPIQYEVKARHKSGRTINASVSINMMPGTEKSVISLIDITDRVQAEESLRRSEEIFRVISNQSLMGIHIIKDGVFKYVNQATADICGYSIEEIMAWGPNEYTKVLHPEDLPLVLEQARKKQRGENDAVTDYEWRLLTRTGEVKWIESYSKTIVFEDEPADMVTITDITARVKAEQALARSEEHFRALIENALDLVTVLKTDGTVTYIGPSVKRILGYEPDELVGKNVFDFIHPEDLGGSMEGLAIAARRTGATEHLELRVRHKDGSWRPHEASSINLLDNPVVQGIVLNSRDITKRKRAEEELGRINHLFLNLGPDLMENIVRVVGAAKEILGVPLAAYARLKAGKLTTLSTAPGEEGLTITEGFEGNISYELISRDAKEPMIMENLEETDYRHTDPIIKEHGFGSFLGYPVELGLRTMGCLCLFDMTGRHFSSQERATLGTLVRALSIEEERLAREENLKDFIDVASHELRHPITILKGYSALLRGQRDKIDVATQDVLLEIIEHGSDRLNALVDGLLAISGIERGRFEVHREARSLVPLIERSIDEMGARGFNNDFTSRISGNLEECSIDGEKFVQLMIILMENAVKYSPSGSPIEVEVGETEGDVLVSVLDRGMGITEDNLERVFDRFFQEEEVAHHSKPGMGMGLYIARNIVEAHGGRIWCEAWLGGGSIFRFTIPA